MKVIYHLIVDFFNLFILPKFQRKSKRPGASKYVSQHTQVTSGEDISTPMDEEDPVGYYTVVADGGMLSPEAIAIPVPELNETDMPKTLPKKGMPYRVTGSFDHDEAEDGSKNESIPFETKDEFGMYVTPLTPPPRSEGILRPFPGQNEDGSIIGGAMEFRTVDGQNLNEPAEVPMDPTLLDECASRVAEKAYRLADLYPNDVDLKLGMPAQDTDGSDDQPHLSKYLDVYKTNLDEFARLPENPTPLIEEPNDGRTPSIQRDVVESPPQSDTEVDTPNAETSEDSTTLD